MPTGKISRPPPMVRLVLCSRYAFYPIHFEAFRHLCRYYAVEGIVIGCAIPDIPSVHQQLGFVDWSSAKTGDGIEEIRKMPDGKRAAQSRWLRAELSRLKPDAVWMQDEPTDYFLSEVLRMYFFRRTPMIITAVCENIFQPGPFWKRLLRRVLWFRLDGLLATAKPSIDGIRKIGMPNSIPTMTLVAGALPPPATLIPLDLPLERSSTDFLVGFAGRICEEKGWKVLLSALALLPPHIKCVLAGDGPQAVELKSWLARPELQGRVCYVGLLPKAELWRFYRTLDCLAVPSLTFPTWKEQFGGVLADGMAVGLPLIGSNSGSIPEVIGPAGTVVPENDHRALADAIRRLSESPDLCRRLGRAGMKRFEAEFAIPAYARKIADALQLRELPVSHAKS